VPNPAVPPQARRAGRPSGRSRADVTRISFASQHLDADLQLGVVLGLRLGPLRDFRVFVGDDQKPRASGILDLGPFRAWIRPSTVQSTITSTSFSASTTARFPAMAQLVPVDFTGTGADCAGVGIWMWKLSAPRS
jgi:hypothetical protein